MRIRDTSIDPHRSRRTQVWRDQHKRPWEVTIDLEAGTHCTPPIPKFKAPLMPPLEYVRPGDTLGTLRIAYELWLPEWAAANERWEERRIEIATREFGEASGGAIEADMPALQRIVGIRPQWPEFVRAAMAGNRWVLGIPRADGSRYPVPPFAEGMLDRLAPREATRTDLDLSALRTQFADVDEDGTAIPLPATSSAARKRAAARDPFAQTVPEGFGGATNFGDAAEDFDDDTGYDAGDAAGFEDAEDEELGDATADASVPAGAVMVRKRSHTRGG